MSNVIIHTDGGARGNPGPAGIGVVIEIDDKTKEYAETIGTATNNQAEYKAVVFALKKAKQLLGAKAKSAKIKVNMDSELIVKQLNMKYKVKNADLAPLFLEVWNLKFNFADVSFSHIRREKNARADKLLNQALDKQALGKKANRLTL